MMRSLSRAVQQWRRQRRLTRIKREFARCGYPLDHLDDSKIEAFVTGGTGTIEEIPISGKTIYFALRRNSQDKERQSGSQTIKAL